MIKNEKLARQLGRLKWLIDSTESASNSKLELQAHWGKYLCVLIAGFLENALGEIYSEYAHLGANLSVARYTSSVVLRIQNPKAKRFIETATAFNPDWGQSLKCFLDGEGRKEAVDAIMNNRHAIAHGRDVEITVARVKGYLEKCVDVVIFLECQCGLQTGKIGSKR